MTMLPRIGPGRKGNGLAHSVSEPALAPVGVVPAVIPMAATSALIPSPSLPGIHGYRGGGSSQSGDDSSLDGETLCESETFLTECEDELSFASQSSLRSFPNHPYALPNTMPHLIRRADRKVRQRQRRNHQREVRRRRERIREAATKQIVENLEEHARRVDARRLRSERREAGRKWLAVCARLAAHDWVARTLRGAAEVKARRAHDEQFNLRKHENAMLIQHAMRNVLLRSGKSQLKDFWRKVARFTAKISPQRWRCALHIKCWRRKSAVRLLKMFLNEGLTHRGTQAVLNFMVKVRRLQRMAVQWLVARAGRKELLRQIWDDVEGILRAELEAVTKAAWNPLSLIKVPKRGSRTFKEPSMSERINDDIAKLRKIEDGMDALMRRQLKAGVPVIGTQSGATCEVPPVPEILRDAAIEDIFNEICRLHTAKHGHAFVTRGANQLNPREFTNKEVKQILALSSTKGQVHRISDKDIYQRPSDVERLNVMAFFTAFEPLSLHEKVTEIWVQVYNTQNAPIANMYLNTLDNTKSERIDPSKKKRRGALRVHKAEHGRRKGTVGMEKSIDLSALDLGDHNNASAASPGAGSPQQQGGRNASFDGSAAASSATRRSSMPQQMLRKLSMGPIVGNATAAERGVHPALLNSNFNSRASQIVSKHLARCAVHAADMQPLESTKRRETAIALKVQRNKGKQRMLMLIDSKRDLLGVGGDLGPRSARRTFA